MKRHEALEPLSRHHFNGLLQAKNLQDALDGSPDMTLEEAVRGFVGWWQAGTQDHFRDEEELLLPHYARFGAEDLPMFHTMLIQHIQIRKAAIVVAEQLEAGVFDQEYLAQVAQLLRDHIRLEEREVFTHIEQKIPDEVLRALGPLFHDVE